MVLSRRSKILRYRALRGWEVPEAELPAVIAQMRARLDREVSPRQAAELWSATYILMGARYEQALIQTLLQGVIAMKEPVTYQAILRQASGMIKW